VALVSGRRERDVERMSADAERMSADVDSLHQPAPHASGDVRPATRRKPSVLDSPATAAVEADAEIRAMDDMVLVAGIARLRRERNALILAHNYQIPAIQDLADFVGDSLELSQRAAHSDASLIVFCGVHFMADGRDSVAGCARVAPRSVGGMLARGGDS
jgi:hypothetical protein